MRRLLALSVIVCSLLMVAAVAYADSSPFEFSGVIVEVRDVGPSPIAGYLYVLRIRQYVPPVDHDVICLNSMATLCASVATVGTEVAVSATPTPVVSLAGCTPTSETNVCSTLTSLFAAILAEPELLVVDTIDIE